MSNFPTVMTDISDNHTMYAVKFKLCNNSIISTNLNIIYVL